MTARARFAVSGRRATLEAVRAGRATEVLVAIEARQTPALRDVLHACEEAGVDLREVPRRSLDELAPDHHGVVARVEPPRALSERDLARFPFAEDAIVVVLDGVSDPQNLGAAARSAEAAGATMLITRIRRSAPVTPASVRASAGALLHLPHARVTNLTHAIERLKAEGFFVVGLDEKASASVFDEEAPSGRLAVVLGSEGSGLSRLVRGACDLVVSLPIYGTVGSLNASAALAAVLYAFALPPRARRGG